METELHRKLVEETADIATIIDSDGTITYVSPSVKQSLGYHPDELIGEVGYEFQHPDDRDGIASAIETVIERPEQVERAETRFRGADGSYHWLEVTLQNRLDDEEIDGILVTSRLITDRKRQEKHHQEFADEYTTLLETVEDGIFYLTVEQNGSGYEFRFERLNRAYEEQTGLTTEEVRGKTPVEVFGDDLGSELHANYHRCVVAGEPIRYQEQVPVETGARFWQTNLAPVVRDGDVERIIGITRNVTEQVKRERQLRSQKEQLDEFASVVSHDLRNPLNVAQARAGLLAEDCDSEHIDPVVRSLDRMEELISDTLTLARQGQVVADAEEVRLVNLVGSCWKSVSSAGASIEIVDEATLVGDRSRLQHVFENLFRNAIQHGGPDVTIRVGRIGDHGVYVEDTGPGIPAEDRAAVFEAGHTTETDGTGFGLTIVKRIAEAHGWNVEICDGTDGGARFEFTDVELV